MTTQTKCFIPQPNELKTFKLRLESWVKDTNNKEEKKLLKEALKHLEESDEAYFIALMSIAQSGRNLRTRVGCSWGLPA